MPDKPTYIKRAHPGKWSMETTNVRMRKRRGYAELQCHSNFSFLRGASHPEELAEQAAALGYEAIAITDRHRANGAVALRRGQVTIHPPVGVDGVADDPRFPHVLFFKVAGAGGLAGSRDPGERYG